MTIDEKTYLVSKRHTFEPTEEGVIQPRLLNIDINHVIPDELHLLLQITDKMIENLINGAITHDHNINNVPSSRVLEGPMLNSLIDEIRNCGITFNIHVPSYNKREFTLLTGIQIERNY